MSLLNSQKLALQPLRIALRGDALLNNPRFSKGTAFTIEERKSFGLSGRLPFQVNTLEEQCDRSYEQLQQYDSPIRKNAFLQSLKDQNWTLYYALLRKHLKELVPVIYTPTQAEAISNYSHLFRKSEGLYLTLPDRDRMEEDFLEQTKGRKIDLFVCTDAEAILGIGDQGVGISTSKSALYTLIGGIDPSRSLSVTLDVGTNNQGLLNDPLYVGWRNNRIRGAEYDEFINKFVQLVRKHFPNSLLHFEDFGVLNAHRLLHRYRDTHAVFNDDIQGTGAVTLACIMAAIRVASPNAAQAKLSEQRYVILGAGSAGMGISVQLRDAMVAADGITCEEANKRFWMVDRDGLLFSRNTSGAGGEFCRSAEEGWDTSAEGKIDLLTVMQRVKPTVLIGCSTASGAFTREVVRAMLMGMGEGERPIIMPLSNPSRLVEAKPEAIMRWTEGRALVATGSPFPCVKLTVEGRKQVFAIAECNNALIYPGLGFGANLAQSRRVTDTMLLAGAKRLALLSPAIKSESSSAEYNGESILPDVQDAPKVNFEIGVAVAEQAVREGSAGALWAHVEKEEDAERVVKEVRQRAAEKVWVPWYSRYVYDPLGIS
ncbi:hypothetical protein BDQ17DRAFT_1392717 [Cyathus striatus]|nr:hypothetical protein BDQ17DRAFT_1392717 [Cyathus striatus]